MGTKKIKAGAGSGTPGGSAARRRLLDAAGELFSAKGLNAVGIEAIIERAGVAKMTLYHHFQSKDDLIAAYVERKDAAWRESFRAAVERLASTRRGRVLAMFDAAGEWFASEEFRGCPFLNTAAELVDAEHPARKIGLAHKRLVREYVEGVVRDAGYADAARLADELVLLLNGATALACLEGTPDAAGRAKRAAKKLLRPVRDSAGATKRGA